MARRGVFGRLPRAAPDLTNSIVALVREAQAQTDQNYVDAWKNGGKVDGKGVSDTRLLSHLKERRDQLSPDDPSWDQWNNNYVQYDFAINESKMTLKNDEGKVSDEEMAGFYRKWAGREDVQQDSEFYRSLLDKAARWHANATARNAANGARAKAEAHNKWVNGYYDKNAKPAKTTNDYLVTIATMIGAAPDTADNLDDMYANSDKEAEFLAVVENGKSNNPAVQQEIDAMTVQLRKETGDPNWTWTQSNILELQHKGDRALKTLVQNSTSDTERRGWQEERGKQRYNATRLKQTAANNRVNIATDDWQTKMDHCNGDPYCARRVTKEFRDKLAAEVPNVVAGGRGGVTLATQDIKTAQALSNTLDQLDKILAGEDVAPPPGDAQKTGAAKSNTDYTVLDAQAGNREGAGELAGVGNAVNSDSTKLDAGGWVMTDTKKDGDGRPLLDGDGNPIFLYRVFGKNEAQPPGSVEVGGVNYLTDNTRVAMPRGTRAGQAEQFGAGVPTVTPPTYVMPSPPSIAYQDEAGQSVDPKSAGPNGVKMTAGSPDPVVPWVELQGVKGLDGKSRTIYRTPDPNNPGQFLFHDQPPVPVDTPRNKAGQVILPTKVTPTGTNNAPEVTTDVSGIMAHIEAGSKPTKSGNFPQGTFTSAGAANANGAIRDAYSSGKPRAAVEADTVINRFQTGVGNMPAFQYGPDGKAVIDPATGRPKDNPAKVAALRDVNQLQQVNTLYKAGKQGSSLAASYLEDNSFDPKSKNYVDQLARAGFTSKKYGSDEVTRRASLLAGIDDANQRLSDRWQAVNAANDFLGKAKAKGFNTLGWGGDPLTAGTGGALSNLDQQQVELSRQRQNVLNPTISVSQIKIPGMQQMTQMGQVPVGTSGTAWKPVELPPPIPAPKTTKPPAGPTGVPPLTTAPPPPPVKPAAVTGGKDDTALPTDVGSVVGKTTSPYAKEGYRPKTGPF